MSVESASRSPSRAAIASASRSGNSSVTTNDYHVVDCTGFREIVSASLDGEATPLEAEAADAHVAACAACATWRGAATSLTRAAPLHIAEPVPDLTASILMNRTPDTGSVAKLGLTMVAVAQVLVGVGALLGAGHLSRDNGVWELALAIGFATAAWRPQRAAGLVPLVAALVVGLLVTASIDTADGTVAMLGEGAHLVPLVGLALLVAETRGESAVAR